MSQPIDPQLALSQALSPGLTAPAGRRPDPEALRRVCQQFEAIFTQALFKSMRATIPDGGLLEKGLDRQIYEELMDAEVANQAARQQGGLGIAEALFRQLAQPEGLESTSWRAGEAAQKTRSGEPGNRGTGVKPSP